MIGVNMAEKSAVLQDRKKAVGAAGQRQGGARSGVRSGGELQGGARDAETSPSRGCCPGCIWTLIWGYEKPYVEATCSSTFRSLWLQGEQRIRGERAAAGGHEELPQLRWAAAELRLQLQDVG